MKPEFDYTNKGKGFITEIIIRGEEIIPSETFDLEDNTYMLLEILTSTEDMLYLHLLGIKGQSLGKSYFIPKHIFEEKNPAEIKELLDIYQS